MTGAGTLKHPDQVCLYLRIHGHCGEFCVDVSAGCCCTVTAEGLWRWHLVPPAKLQRTAAILLFDLRQVWLCRYHHTWSLAVHEVLLAGKWREGFFFKKMPNGNIFFVFCVTDEHTVLPQRLWHSIQRSMGYWHHKPDRQCRRPDHHQKGNPSRETLHEAEKRGNTD